MVDRERGMALEAPRPEKKEEERKLSGFTIFYHKRLTVCN